MADTIANSISQMTNAGAVGKKTFVVSATKLLKAVFDVLKKENYIENYEEKTVEGKPCLVVTVAYENGDPRVRGVRRISKLSQRVYTSTSDIREVRHGYGTVIISTPEGVMTGEQAKTKNLGGEVLFEIW